MEKCTKSTKVTNIKVHEPRSRHAVFSNPANEDYKVIRFDGCVVKQATACDFIIEKCGVARLAVELKGGDIIQAARQISASLHYLKTNGFNELKTGGLIVCTQVPSFNGTAQKVKAQIAREHRVPLTIKQDGRNLKIEDLVK